MPAIRATLLALLLLAAANLPVGSGEAHAMPGPVWLLQPVSTV